MRLGTIAKILVVEADIGVLGHHPAPLLDDRALERRLLPGLAYDLLEIVVVEDAAHDIFRAWLLPALEEGDLKASLGHGDGGGASGRARTHNDGVELLLVSHRSQSYANP